LERRRHLLNSIGGGPLAISQLQDGESGQVDATSALLVRDWNEIMHVAKSPYGIDSSLSGVALWVCYDATLPAGNVHNDVFESGLSSCQELPLGSVTSVEWFAVGEGALAYMDVDPASGTLWPPVLDYIYDSLLDCNSNGQFDRDDISGGISLESNLDYVPDECTSSGSNYCSSQPNSSGVAAVISMSRSPILSLNELTLRAEPVSNQPIQFLLGLSQVQIPFGDGARCVGGSIVRVNPPGQAIAGVAARTLDVAAIGLLPGTTNFQCIFRDPTAGMSGFNLSDGLSISLLP
jgi:hypothetical protein